MGKSHNDHGVDCVTFCELQSPHRWAAVRDFMSDNNGTVDFSIPIGDWMDPVVASCGLPPDQAAILREPLNMFDQMADRAGWGPATRKVEHHLYTLVAKANRLQWLEDQLAETLKTDSVPLKEMTRREKRKFLRELTSRKKQRVERKRKERSAKRPRFYDSPPPLPDTDTPNVWMRAESDTWPVVQTHYPGKIPNRSVL